MDLSDAESSVIVHTTEEVDSAIRDDEVANATKYITVKKDSLYGKEDIGVSDLIKCVIRYEDSQTTTRPYIQFDGVPFVILGRKRLACQHGKDYHAPQKEKRKQQEESSMGDHTYRKKRKIIQDSKKKDCPAHVRVRHVVRFPDFKVKEDAKRSEKDHESVAIKQMLRQKKQIKMEHAFYISIPKNEEHKNHVMGEDASLIQPIDNELKKYISLMVSQHQVSNTFHMKLLLEVYVKQVLFANESIPSKLNKRFWPSVKDIRNHMALSLLRLRNTNVDQAVVSEMVVGWRKQFPNDMFLLRTKDVAEEQENIDLPACPDDEDDSTGDVYLNDETLQFVNVTDKKFLFVHQTDFQRRLLLRYGQEICLMDATYRTTQYSLPLYFICVPTNVNYMTVATFITETEDSQSLIEVLQELRRWNPEWSPSFFMCDYAFEEINAIESVFPDSFVYLCDFHREQSWERWINASHNGVQHFKSQILALLRKLAMASSQEEFEEATEMLKGSMVWKENKNLRCWFERHWLSKADRWVRAFRQNRFNVSINTNNGIERQNMALKYEFLQSKKASSLSSLLNIIIENFNFSAYRKYRQLNVQASDQARKYSDNIPDFLINRPPDFVKHAFTRWQEAENIPLSDIDVVDGCYGEFLVRSQTGPNTALHYLVQFVRNEIGLPSCNCKDWQQTHLLCKHFFAVFRHFDDWGWDQLPLAYRSSPFLNLDILDMEIQQVEHHLPEVDTYNEDANTNELDKETGDIFVELPVTSAAALKRTKQKVGSLCEIIKDLSHKAKDISVLDSAIASLSTVIDTMKSSVPQTDDFLLDDADMLHIGTPKRNIRNTRKAAPLKKTRPKKRASGRVGIKANRQKEANSALNDMINNSKDSSCSASNGMEVIIEEIIDETGVDRTEREDHTESQSLDKEKDDERTVRKDHTDSQSSEKDEEMVLNHQVIEIDDVINKFKEYLKKECSKKNLIEEARRTSKFIRDMTARIGDAVLHQSTDATEFLLLLTAEIVDDIPATIKCRMVYIILSHLVESGLINLPSDIDPRLQQERLDQLMKELLQAANHLNQTTEKNIASNALSGVSKNKNDKPGKVRFTEKAMQFKERKMAELKKCSPDPFPGGGLLNPPRMNLCFANSLLQCLRLADMHKVLQHHKNCKDNFCFTCGLKEFFEMGPITAQPLCEKMTKVWPNYTVGQQQDPYEMYTKIMEEVQAKCFNKLTCMSDERRIFYGQLQYSYSCKTCGSKSNSTAPFTDLPLSIVKHQTLSQCLEEHFSEEKVDKTCLCCRKNTEHSRLLQLKSVPKNLVLNLNRFTNARKKVMKKIDLHLNLNLRQYVVENGKEEHKLDLFGVVIHKGQTLSTGHYITLVKFGTDWYRVDDMKIQKLSTGFLGVIDGQPTMLFYRTLKRPYVTE